MQKLIGAATTCGGDAFFITIFLFIWLVDNRVMISAEDDILKCYSDCDLVFALLLLKQRLQSIIFWKLTFSTQKAHTTFHTQNLFVSDHLISTALRFKHLQQFTLPWRFHFFLLFLSSKQLSRTMEMQLFWMVIFFRHLFPTRFWIAFYVQRKWFDPPDIIYSNALNVNALRSSLELYDSFDGGMCFTNISVGGCVGFHWDCNASHLQIIIRSYKGILFDDPECAYL